MDIYHIIRCIWRHPSLLGVVVAVLGRSCFVGETTSRNRYQGWLACILQYVLQLVKLRNHPHRLGSDFRTLLCRIVHVFGSLAHVHLLPTIHVDHVIIHQHPQCICLQQLA